MMQHILINRVLLICFAAFFLLLNTGCDEQPDGVVKKETRMKPVFDRKKIDAGFIIYIANCQKCHGVNGIGAKDWRTPEADGKYPPPPLNGTGHTWHHPRPLLEKIILEGTEPKGNMPGWADKLSNEDVDNIITWFQSTWQPQVYHAWSDIDKRKE